MKTNSSKRREGYNPGEGYHNAVPGRNKPANAVDVRDDARMLAWAEGRVTIVVHDDGMVRIDSDFARQLGLMQDH